MSIGDLWNKGYLLSLLEEGQTPVVFYTILIGGILFAAILVPYLLGSINSAIIYSRLRYRDDVRNHGSGNAGMTNMLRTYGKSAAVFTLLGDVLKSAVAVVFASFLTSVHIGGWIAGLFCMVGHVFPIFYRFRGGKGVLCAATAMAILSPLSFVCCLAVFIAIVAMSKYVSLGSIVAAFFFPLFVNFFMMQAQRGGLWGLSIAMALFVVWCHRSNIKRIQNGTESKLSFKKKPIVPKATADVADEAEKTGEEA